MLRIWHSCLHPTLCSATNLAFALAFPQTFSATNPAFAPEFLLSAVPRIWHSRLHSRRHSVHESCIQARISTLRSVTNLAFAPASYLPQCRESRIRACIPLDIQCTNPAFEPEFLLSAMPRIWHSRLHSLKHSVPRILHSRLNSYLPQCHESGIRACIPSNITPSMPQP